MYVDEYAPCDTRATDARELCAVPIVSVNYPAVLSSCPDTPLELDASGSAGGGIKPLALSWRASPFSCDNYAAVHAALQAAGSAPRAQLSAELNGGEAFEIVVRATSFLGTASESVTVLVTRSTLPIPTITIDAPAELLVSSSTADVVIGAKAALASCLSASVKIVFRWSNTMQEEETEGGDDWTPLPDEPALELDTISRGTRTLLFQVDQAPPGRRYTLCVQGCMADAPEVCGSACVKVIKRDMPVAGGIAGGDRTVGQENLLLVDACDVHDPDDDGGTRCAAGEACSVLRFEWGCKACSSDPTDPSDALRGNCTAACAPEAMEAASDTACTWEVAPRILAPGHYNLSTAASAVEVSGSGGAGGDRASSSVLIEVKAGLLPMITMERPPAAKHNTNDHLVFTSSHCLPVELPPAAASPELMTAGQMQMEALLSRRGDDPLAHAALESTAVCVDPSILALALALALALTLT